MLKVVHIKKGGREKAVERFAMVLRAKWEKSDREKAYLKYYSSIKPSQNERENKTVSAR